MSVPVSGGLRKMLTALDGATAQYTLPVGDERVPLNEHLGARISLKRRTPANIRMLSCVVLRSGFSQ